MANDTVIAKGETIKGESIVEKAIDTLIDVPIPEKPSEMLVSILRTKRAHTSKGDYNFRAWLTSQLQRLGFPPTVLAEGCLLVRTNPKSDTLFSCHIDTCHSQVESDDLTGQDLAYDPAFGDILLPNGTKSACLGADDGAGIYVMLRMIEAKVPGSYLFHTGEERGGLGAYAMLRSHAALLDEFSRAIAFDRAVQRGENPEVIHTQGGRACASIAAAEALCGALNKTTAIFEKQFVTSAKGSFTDTKVYAGIIPECFNVGVFYASQHTPREWLNVAGLEQLVKACLEVKWDELPVLRKPAPEPQVTPKSPMGFQGWEPPAKQKKKKDQTQVQSPLHLSFASEIEVMTLKDIEQMAYEEPDTVAKMVVFLRAKLAGAEAELDSYRFLLEVD